jgi:hypothetical protein
MMATEDVAQHQAMVELHEAECALERDDLREAERHCLCAVAWMREVVRESSGLAPIQGDV